MKNLIFLLALILLSCNQSKNDHTPNNKEIVLRLYEQFNNHNWEEFAKCYADTAMFLDPSLGKEYVNMNHKQIVEKYTDLQSFAPDVHDEIIGMYVSGNKIVVEFISSGTANDKQWQLPICSIYTIEDGKIVRDATYFDM